VERIAFQRERLAEAGELLIVKAGG